MHMKSCWDFSFFLWKSWFSHIMILMRQSWFLTWIHVPLEESASHPLSLNKRECPKLYTHTEAACPDITTAHKDQLKKFIMHEKLFLGWAPDPWRRMFQASRTTYLGTWRLSFEQGVKIWRYDPEQLTSEGPICHKYVCSSRWPFLPGPIITLRA